MKTHLTKKSLEIIADFLDCQTEIIKKPLKLKREVLDILKKNKIDVIRTIYFKFPNKGATIISLLADSHLAIHTWPEKSLANFDLFFCNFKRDNTRKVENSFKMIEKLFSPQKTIIKKIQRFT